MKATHSLLIQGVLALVLLQLAAASRAPAQDATLVTAGTTYDSPQGGRWAYLFWRAEDPAILSGQGALANVTFAAYAKAGSSDSNAPYARVAQTVRQPNTGAVAALLNLSVNVGQNLAVLRAELDEIFHPLIPPEAAGADADLLLADKVGVLLASAETDAEVAGSLFFLGREHPAIEMARGAAVAVPMPAAQTTFEIRLVDANGVEQAVAGRVTLNGAAAAPRLPAPGRPVFVPVKVAPEPGNVGTIGAAAVNAERQAIANRTLDRVARLRWGTPDELLRAAPLQHGYNVYRVERAYAEAQGWHTTPPAPQLLRQRADLALVPQVRRANSQSPVLPDEDLSPAKAEDLDNDDYFFVDDQRSEPGAEEPFTHGSQFYYFVCARDVLGRDGLVSQGTLVTMVNRLPPEVVTGVAVTNDYSWTAAEGSRQRLRVRWEPEPADMGPHGELRYHVFRWPTADAYQAHLSRLDAAFLDGEGRQFGRVTPEAGLAFAPGARPEFLDDGPDAPSELTPRRAYWYTVVRTESIALDPLEGGGGIVNVSAHSAPAHGVIRDWEGPAAPEAELLVDCHSPLLALQLVQTYAVPSDERVEGFVRLQLECSRDAPAGIDWAEFVVDGQSLGRVFFEPGALQVRRTFSVPEQELLNLLAENSGPQGVIQMRAGSNLGEGAATGYVVVQASDITDILDNYKDSGVGIRVVGVAAMQSQKVPVSGLCNGGVALPEDPATGEPAECDGLVWVDPSTPEWRVYRSVNDGPLLLVASGAHKEPVATAVSWVGRVTDVEGALVPDPDAPADPGDLLEWPANGGRICFYVQTLDVDGNGSPFARFCVSMPPRGVATGRAQAHRPVIAETKAVGEGTDTDPARLRIRWVAATGATRRFHLVINDSGDTPPETYAVEGLGANLFEEGVEDGAPSGLAGVYPILASRARQAGAGGAAAMAPPEVSQTSGAALGADDLGDTFEIELPVEPGREYRVSVQAVGPVSSRDASGVFRDWGVIAVSDPVDAVWLNPLPPSTAQPDVMPWPQRGSKTGTLSPEVWAKFLDEPGFQGVGIRVGHLRTTASGTYTGDGKPGYYQPLQFVREHVNPREFLFRQTERNQRFRQSSRPLSPFVLYRHRLPTGAEAAPALERAVDITQVSPMIEQIAVEHTDSLEHGDITVIRDPFVRLVPTDGTGTKLDIYLLDTHPVVRGERYRYTLVRFDAAREIEKSYPVRAVDDTFAEIPAVEIPEL